MIVVDVHVLYRNSRLCTSTGIVSIATNKSRTLLQLCWFDILRSGDQRRRYIFLESLVWGFARVLKCFNYDREETMLFEKLALSVAQQRKGVVCLIG